jgi:hypothetical protein
MSSDRLARRKATPYQLDYALLDEQGKMLVPAVSCRDARRIGVIEPFCAPPMGGRPISTLAPDAVPDDFTRRGADGLLPGQPGALRWGISSCRESGWARLRAWMKCEGLSTQLLRAHNTNRTRLRVGSSRTHSLFASGETHEEHQTERRGERADCHGI